MTRENAITKVIHPTIKTVIITSSSPNPDNSKDAIKPSSPNVFSNVSAEYVFICLKVRKYVSIIS